MNILSAINCVISIQIITSWALEEIPAPNLSTDQKYLQPWNILEHHRVSAQGRFGEVQALVDTPRTLQSQSVRSQRGIEEQSGLFLPGLGMVKNYLPAQRKQAPYKRLSLK